MLYSQLITSLTSTTVDLNLNDPSRDEQSIIQSAILINQPVADHIRRSASTFIIDLKQVLRLRVHRGPAESSGWIMHKAADGVLEISRDLSLSYQETVSHTHSK